MVTKHDETNELPMPEDVPLKFLRLSRPTVNTDETKKLETYLLCDEIQVIDAFQEAIPQTATISHYILRN